MQIQKPYLIFLGDAKDKLAAKTAHGVVDWRPQWCVGQMRLPNCQADVGLQDMNISEGKQAGAKSMLIGVANAGGILADHWTQYILEALEAGMDIVSGLHMRLTDHPQIAQKAKELGRQLIDIRHPTQRFDTGKGTKRSGKRILAVGTDCSVGKKYTALALEKEMVARGMDATFRATGQTGLLIAERGVAIDAIVSDFISGAVEWLSPEADANHWDIIEGQGSLFHPSFAGVSLGLLHGAQPDLFVICHEPTRTNMRGVSAPIPSIKEVIDLTIMCGKLTNPNIKPLGIAINTQALSDADAKAYLAKVEAEYKLPTNDPIRYGVANIIDALG